jgi:hypothetical protein
MSRNSKIVALLPVTLIVGLASAGCNDDRATEPGNTDVGETGEDTGTVEVGDDTSVDAEEDERITLDVGPSSCPEEDEFSPNHELASAYRIEGGSLRASDLFVCEGYDDWFIIPARANRAIRAQISFVNDVGDLDLFLLAPGQSDPTQAVAQAATEADLEALRYVPTVDGDYVLFVDGFEDASGSYDLTVVLQCTADSDCDAGQRCSLVEGACVADVEPACGFDDGEPNNSLSEAETLTLSAGRVRLSGRNVCEEDDDYFKLVLSEPSTVRVELNHDIGEDLTLTVFNEAGVLEARGTAPADSNVETLLAPLLPAGTHFIAVDDAVIGLGLDVGYDLTVEVESDGCTTDVDCGTVPGRQLCVDGGCVGFTPEGEPEPGSLCDDDTDCPSGLFCYAGGPGISDNHCTQQCEDDARCEDYEGGYCLFLGGRTAVCMDTCTQDSDCPTVYSCNAGNGQCELVSCGVDSDCEGEQICRRSEQQDLGFCTENRPFSCRDSDTFEPNDDTSSATVLDGTTVRGATICNVDEDWYRVTVAEDGTRLEATVDFEEGVDIDVFVYDLAGRTVGQGSEPTSVPEQAVARYLAAGDYLIRVNQFPGDVDRLTTYELSIETRTDRCSDEGQECLALTPLRIVCDVEGGGACNFLEGNGEVAPGGFCDSDNDCAEPAEFCWAFESATEGRNICTRQCGNNTDCDEFTGTVCTPVGRRFSACLPG